MTGHYRHVWRAGAADAPVLVLLHGTGGGAADMLRLGAAVAPAAGMLALEGDVDEAGQARFFRRRAEGVYDLADLAMRTERLDAFLADAFAEYGIEAGRAAGVGYSNGANMLASLGFRHPGRLRRLALLHPLIPFRPDFAPGTAGLEVAVTAGEQDPICPAPMTRALIGAWEAVGARVAPFWHPGGHEIRPGEIAHVAGFLAAPAG